MPPYLDTDPGRVKAKCYDLVLNGVELASGSMRITDSELQEHMFRSLGLTDEEIEAKFGFLVDAYHYGARPTAAWAWGWTGCRCCSAARTPCGTSPLSRRSSRRPS